MPDQLEATCRVVQGVTRGPMLYVGLPRRRWGRTCGLAAAVAEAAQPREVANQGR